MSSLLTSQAAPAAPSARPFDQMHAAHVGARGLLHPLHGAGVLIDTPVALPPMKSDGTSIVRPENVWSSVVNLPLDPIR